MKNKSSLIGLPVEIRAMILNYLDLKSLTFFGKSDKQNFHEVLSILPKALAGHFPRNVGLVAGCRGSSFFYFNNTCYACGSAIPDYPEEFEDIQTSQNKLPGNILQVATGFDHSLILTTQGLFAFGNNTTAQLGLGDEKSRRDNFEEIKKKPENIVEVSLAYVHSLVRTRNGKLYACGSNKLGKFGLKNDKYNEFVFVPIPSNSPIVQISAGRNHNLVLNKEGKVYFCGELYSQDHNTWMELTNIKGKVIKIFASEGYAILWTSEGVFGYGRGGSWQGYDLLSSLSATTVKQIAVGGKRVLILTQNGKLYNYDVKPLQLSELDYLEGIKQIAIGSQYSLVITENGLYACGANNLGQLGLGDVMERKAWSLVEKVQPLIKEIFNFDDYLTKLKMMDMSFQKVRNQETDMEIENEMVYSYY